MKKSFYLVLVLLSVLLCSCETFVPPMCKVIVSDDIGNGSVLVDEESVPYGSLIAVTVVPDDGYYFGTFLQTSRYTQDSEKANVYYVCVNNTNYEINCSFYQKTKYLIYNDVDQEKGSITIFDEDKEAYEGQIVKFKIIPDSHYYYEDSSIKISKFLDPETTYDFEATNEKDVYSFVMPDQSVSINIDFEIALEFVPSAEKYTIGEKAAYMVVNHTGKTDFDIYINYCPNFAENILFAEKVDLSSGTYELDTNLVNIGKYWLMATENGETDMYDLCKTVVEPEDMNEGWTAVGMLYDSSYTSTTSTSKNIITDVLLNNLPRTDKIYTCKYYFKSNPSEIKSKTVILHTKTDVSFEYIYDQKDAVVFYIEDEDSKVISGKVEIEVPCYTNLPSSKTVTYAHDNDVINLSYTDFRNCTITAEEGTEDYFTITVTKEAEDMSMTIDCLKPTAIPRSIYIKNADGDVIRTLKVTIPYAGSPEITVKGDE